jgi:protein-disulfide isomerase
MRTRFTPLVKVSLQLARNSAWAIFFAAIAVTPLRAQRPSAPAVASVDGVAITADDLDAAIGSVTYPLDERLFQIRKQAVDALVKQRLLEREAARRKISLQSLIDTEVTAKVGAISDEEIDRLKTKSDPALSRDDIRKALLKDKVGAELNRFVATLERTSSVRVLLEAPRAPRSILETAKAPAKGPANAPVTIVEFTDFHCSHCQAAEAVLGELLSTFPVRLVHRDLPLENAHPRAKEAHEAARCADAQGRFWQFRELLFAGDPKSGDALKASAGTANLDLAAYDRCMAAGAGRSAIDADAADAKRLGVKSTPTFFINGRELEGPATLEALTAAVRSELPRTSRTK